MLYTVFFIFIVKKWEMYVDTFNNNKISKGSADIFYKIIQIIHTYYNYCQLPTKPNMFLLKKLHEK